MTAAFLFRILLIFLTVQTVSLIFIAVEEGCLLELFNASGDVSCFSVQNSSHFLDAWLLYVATAQKVHLQTSILSHPI